MGCDIHLVLEQKHGNKWVGIDTFNSHECQRGNGVDMWASPLARERNYKRFAALAAVRGDGPSPKGVPDDASETTRFLIEEWRADGHSHSWHSIRNAALLFAQTAFDAKEVEPKSYRADYPASYWFGVEGENLDDYRLVFWFDN